MPESNYLKMIRDDLDAAENRNDELECRIADSEKLLRVTLEALKDNNELIERIENHLRGK
jgi:uncharacterized coiled-coil protein SlyX